MTDPRAGARRARSRTGRRREAPRRERPFPPMIEYAPLAGWPTSVRFVLSTAALPLEVAVTGVRILKDVEVILAELGGQLGALRPAVEALGDAYADGYVPIVETTDDYGDDVGASPRSVSGLVLAPVTAVRDVFFGDSVGEERLPENLPGPARSTPAVAATGEERTPGDPEAEGTSEPQDTSLLGWARRGPGLLLGPFFTRVPESET